MARSLITLASVPRQSMRLLIISGRTLLEVITKESQPPLHYILFSYKTALQNEPKYVNQVIRYSISLPKQSQKSRSIWKGGSNFGDCFGRVKSLSYG